MGLGVAASLRLGSLCEHSSYSEGGGSFVGALLARRSEPWRGQSLLSTGSTKITGVKPGGCLCAAACIAVAVGLSWVGFRGGTSTPAGVRLRGGGTCPLRDAFTIPFGILAHVVIHL